ncbi:RICIN domain-containing protein [Bifidobacterium adolescentis]|uniref:RICIN domain-containing protein n=1 Tax=Bifidobacterium adolescentis TaxID=1680 RepID=UPI003CE57002
MKHRKPAPAWQMLGLKISKKVVVGITAAATALGGLAIASTAAQANTGRDSYADTTGNPTFEAAREKYGLTKNMKNGAILHAWMWSFNTITEHMDEIAEAGYTSIQTEPMSKIKEVPANGKKFTENWYYVYQPANTSIGNFVVGTEADLKKMTAAAHAHGIRIIVDVVANHFTADWNAIDPDWQNPEYFHDKNACKGRDINYSNRWEVTHCQLLGLWDLNTANKTVESRMHDFLKTAVDDGVDGFRFDAGKHVELPGEFDNSTYWDVILQNGAQYQYGEVLQGDPGLDYKAYAALYAKYGKGGGGATASDYGKAIRGALKDKNLNAGNLNSLRGAGIADDHLVTWVESHDNYANGDKESTYLTSEQIRFGWAIVGARKGGAPLFFNRPKDSGGNKPQFAETSQLGDAGDDEWKKPEVVAVNQFRNAMDGEDEYLRNCGANQNNNSCLMVERYIKDGNFKNDGVTITNMGDTQELSGTATNLDDGTYKDQVSGGTITVSGGKITSGSAPGGKISVFFTDNSGSVSATPGDSSFKTDTTTVTLNANNVTDATYTTSEGKSGSYQDGDTITIGASTAIGDTITVKLQGKDADGQTVSATYKYTKKDPAATSTAYAKKPSAWSNLYAYVYVDDSSATTLKENAKWPGEPMTQVASGDTCGKDDEYKYEIPDDLEGSNTRIIFNDGNATNTQKYPADTTEGVDAAGLKIDGNYAWDGNTSSGAWEARNCVVIPTKSVKIDQSDYSVDLSNGVTTKQLTATTDPKGASVSWSSSNKDVATVSPKGVVTPRKAGKATITAKSGTKTSSITVTVTGQLPPDPVAKNTIYAAKPSGWGKIYAYVYTGDGATAANNAAWPGVEMTATTATDGCKQSGYKYEVPDNLAKGAKVIFNDGGSQQYPGSRQPGLDYNGGIVKWDGSSAALGAVECETTIPVTSVSISGDGVSGGKLSLKSGASAQLTATVRPDDATDRKVTWTSSDSSVANVMGTGVVTAGSKAGTATIKATAGGKSASVQVTVSAPQDPYAQLDALAKAHASDLADGTYVVSTALKDGMLLDVAGGSKKDGGNVLIYTATGGANQQWRVSHDPKGYVTLSNVNSGKVLDVAGGSARNGANALQYSSNGGRNQKWVAVRSGSSYRLVSAMSQSLVLDVAGWSTKNGTNVDVWTSNGGANQQWKFRPVGQSQKSATVWYRPSSAQSRVRVQWRVYGSPDTTGGTEMTKACGGWWKATVPSAGSTKVGLSFSYGSTSDDNGGKLYDVKGESAAVSGGQAVTDVTPNCVVTTKQ